LAALVTVAVSGPTYTEAQNQGAMVVRFFGLVAWFFIAVIGSIITLLAIKPKGGREYLTSGCASLASAFLFYAISISIK
jgi:hypothetical protein